MEIRWGARQRTAVWCRRPAWGVATGTYRVGGHDDLFSTGEEREATIRP